MNPDQASQHQNKLGSGGRQKKNPPGCSAFDFTYVEAELPAGGSGTHDPAPVGGFLSPASVLADGEGG